MKILFLTDNFPPESNAPASRTFDHCKIWAAQGMEVTVITCFPNFPQGRVYSGYKNGLCKTEMIDGIRVIRVWSFIHANKGTIKRTLDFISFGISSFLGGLFVRTDLIIATSPQFFTAVSGRWLSFFKRKPWVMEVRDLWPESINAVGILDEKSMIYRLLEGVEMRTYRSADKIVVVTDAFRKKLMSRGIEGSKMKVIKNGVLSDQYSPISKDLVLLRELGLENKFVVGYIGTHGLAHALDFILKSAALIKNPAIHFLLLGDGAQKENLQSLHKKLKLTNVTLLPFVSKSEVPKYISLLDVALVNLKKSDTFKTVIPSKIFENAAMGKPILLGVEGESQEIIEQFDAGVCFEPENEQEFLLAVDSLVQNKDLFNRLQLNCNKLSHAFDRKKLAHDMLNHLKEIVEKK